MAKARSKTNGAKTTKRREPPIERRDPETTDGQPRIIEAGQLAFYHQGGTSWEADGNPGEEDEWDAFDSSVSEEADDSWTWSVTFIGYAPTRKAAMEAAANQAGSRHATAKVVAMYPDFTNVPEA